MEKLWKKSSSMDGKTMEKSSEKWMGTERGRRLDLIESEGTMQSSTTSSSDPMRPLASKRT